MRQWLQDAATKTVDAAAAITPQAVPEDVALGNCKVIAHRGAHDSTRIIENTLPAFTTASAAGVWGVECDIRWTADLVPVIHHDPTCQRLFGYPSRLASLNYSEIQPGRCRLRTGRTHASHAGNQGGPLPTRAAAEGHTARPAQLTATRQGLPFPTSGSCAGQAC